MLFRELWIELCLRAAVVEKAGAVVLFGKAFEGAVFVLLDANVDITGYADVERSGVAAHDVGVAGLHFFLPLDLRRKG